MVLRGLWIILVAMITAAVRVAGASTIIVDDFSSASTNGMPNPIFGCVPGSGQGTCFIDQTNVAQNAIGTGPTVTDGPFADVLGGTRKLTVAAESFQSVPGLPDQVVAGVVPLASFLEYNSTQGADGLIQLLYDGGGVGLGASLALSQGVRIVILDADSATRTCDVPMVPCTPGYDVTITITDGATNSASITRSILLPGPVTLSFPFSSFSGINSVNLNDVFSLELTIDPNFGGDMILGRIEISDLRPPPSPVPALSLNIMLLLVVVLILSGWRLLARRLAK